MGILKVASRSRFAIVDRRTVRDTRLSFRSLGLLVRLLDQPDDAEVDSAKLADSRPEGRDAIRAAMRELEQYGYLERSRVQGDGGKWRTVTWVHERPPVAGQGVLTGDGISGAGPTPGKPTPGQPVAGSPGAKTEVPTVANATAKRAAREAAHGIVGRVYRARTPRPATPFTTAVGIVERVLLAGHDAARVEIALGAVRSVSLSAVEHELAGPRRGAGKPVDQGRDAEAGRVAL